MSLSRQTVSPSIFSCLMRKLVHFNEYVIAFLQPFCSFPSFFPPKMPQNSLSIKQRNLAMKMFRDVCFVRQKHALLLLLMGFLKESVSLLF